MIRRTNHNRKMKGPTIGMQAASEASSDEQGRRGAHEAEVEFRRVQDAGGLRRAARTTDSVPDDAELEANQQSHDGAFLRVDAPAREVKRSQVPPWARPRRWGFGDSTRYISVMAACVRCWTVHHVRGQDDGATAAMSR